MIRTPSPCCQSVGANDNPHTSPTAVISNPRTASQGSRAPDKRKKRPGLASQCSDPLTGLARRGSEQDAAVELAFIERIQPFKNLLTVQICVARDL
jgi:hypothetical protein